MKNSVLSCSIVLFCTVNFAFADDFLWQGDNRASVNSVSSWFNETTGGNATVLPSADDFVTIDFQDSAKESGLPYTYQIITFLGADINWGDTVFRNINASDPSNDILNKFISPGTGRNVSMQSLSYEKSVNPNYLWLGGGDSATPANITIVNSVQMGSVSDTSAMKGVLVFGGNSNVGAGSRGGAIGPCLKVSIGGDVVTYGNSTLGFNTNFSGSTDAPSVSIGGVIRMNAVNGTSPTLWLTNRTYSSASGVNTHVKARGLEGSGTVRNNLTSGFTNFNTTLELATQVDDNFTFDGYINSESNYSNKLNIINSGVGKQTLVLRNADTVLTDSSVFVESGSLELYNENSAFNSLTLSSGIFGAASPEEATAGIAKFSMGTFDGGALSVDIFSETSNDVIIFVDSLNIGTVTTVEVGLSNFTGSEGEYTYSVIETPEINGIDLLSIGEYFIAVDSYGNPIESAMFSYSDSKIYLTINVPEPSFFAAAFGAISLGFVAWRKRK